MSWRQTNLTSCCHPLPAAARSSTSISRGTIRIPLHKWGYWPQVGVRKWMGTCGNPFKVSWSLGTFWLEAHGWLQIPIMLFSGHRSLVARINLQGRHIMTSVKPRVGEIAPPSLAGSQVFAVFQTLMTCRRSEPQLFWLSLISDCEVLIRTGPVLKPWRFLRHSWWLQLLSPVQFQRPSRGHPESAVDSLAF